MAGCCCCLDGGGGGGKDEGISLLSGLIPLPWETGPGERTTDVDDDAGFATDAAKAAARAALATARALPIAAASCAN